MRDKIPIDGKSQGNESEVTVLPMTFPQAKLNFIMSKTAVHFYERGTTKSSVS